MTHLLLLLILAVLLFGAPVVCALIGLVLRIALLFGALGLVLVVLAVGWAALETHSERQHAVANPAPLAGEAQPGNEHVLDLSKLGFVPVDEGSERSAPATPEGRPRAGRT
jgi:hypothetical protein